MRTSLIFICFFLFTLSVFSQDSLVQIRDLKFLSDIEKVNYLSFVHHNDVSLLTSLLLSTKADLTNEQVAKTKAEIDALINTLKIGGIDKKKPQKKVKEVYEFVHRVTLKKYEMICRFDELFSTGTYNCLTATALYALLFENLGIPYEVRELPSHVYLVAYPKTENIKVETTAPFFGYISFDANYKKKFLETLKSLKIISADEATARSEEDLFNQYYFASESIDLQKVVGLHYVNDAIFKKDEGQTSAAYRQLEKSYLLYPSPRCQFLLMNFCSDVIATTKLPPREKAILLSKIARYRDSGTTISMINGEFYRLTEDVLVNSNNKQLYRECYDLFMVGQDKEVSDEITYIFNYENGRAYYNQDNYVMAKPYFEKALRQHPDNVDLNKVFIGVLVQNFQRIRKNATLVDSLNYYRTAFPALEQYNSFNTLYASSNLAQFQNEFIDGRPDSGDKFRLAFEADMKKHPEIKVTDYEIENAYASAVTYYGKRGQKAKAQEMCKRGLELSPTSSRLKFLESHLQ